MKKICIIIPAYNEENAIAAVISDIKQHGDADVIVIDDGSSDLTAVEAQEAGALVIRHPFNMGYGVALQTGYKYAVQKHYDLLVQMDGDGQHKADYIQPLCRAVKDDLCDVAIGSRFLLQDRYRLGILKTLGIWAFRLLIRVFTGKRITDPTSGFQCMKREVFEFFSYEHFPWDYPDANVIIMLHRAGFRIREVPVAMRPNPEGRSMHRGIFKISYYLFTVLLSIFVTLIRKIK